MHSSAVYALSRSVFSALSSEKYRLMRPPIFIACLST